MIGIISDIHGNYVALRAVLARLSALGVQDIICLGDISGYYCQINECIEEIRQRGIFTLMGNHDWYLATGHDCPRSKSANVCLNYQRRVLTEENKSWLATLKPQAIYENLNIVHGGWDDPMDEYVTPSSEYFSAIEGAFFASGHTHVSVIWKGIGKTYCNPGSVGQPRDGDMRTSFATFEAGKFTLHRIGYDIVEVQRAMKMAGFESYYYENLNVGTRIGGRIDKLHALPPQIVG